jgi:hypothetical protein
VWCTISYRNEAALCGLALLFPDGNSPGLQAIVMPNAALVVLP